MDSSSRMTRTKLADALGAAGKDFPWGLTAVLVGAVFFLDTKRDHGLPNRIFPRDLCADEVTWAGKRYAVQYRYLGEVDGISIQVTKNPFRNPKVDQYWVSCDDLRGSAGNLESLMVVKLI